MNLGDSHQGAGAMKIEEEERDTGDALGRIAQKHCQNVPASVVVTWFVPCRFC